MAEEHTATQRAALRLRAGVADGIGNGRCTGLFTCQGNGHRYIARAAGKSIGMQSKTVVAGLQQRGGGAPSVTTAALQVQLARYTTLGIKQALLRDAVVDHVDHTTHGAAAVHQCARAAQHFDAVHGDRVGRHGMVVAQARGVHTGAAVLQDAHPVAIEPADDGAAGVGAKVAATDAGCAV